MGACQPNADICTTTTVQKSINTNVSFSLEDNVLTLIIGNKRFQVTLPSSEGGSGSLNINEIEVPITIDGQTTLLNVIPSDKVLVALFFNGIKQKKAVGSTSNDYSISGNSILWTSNVPLGTSDKIEIWTT